MITDTGEMLRIKLDGDWSMSGVAAQFPLLADCLVHLTDADAAGGKGKGPSDILPEIDLAEVTDFDACGCQLMALFIHNLRQNGISAQLINIPESFRSKIHFLGFDNELNISL